MAKITVDLDAFYGYSCGGHGHGSNQTVEMEISEKELEALKKFGKSDITAEEIVDAIESGDDTLESLHEQLSDKYYYMVEEYWLYEAYNECLYECLEQHIKEDIEEGLYSPVLLEKDEDDFDDEEYEDNYDLDAYYEWIKEHDHGFAAERVGLDLDACRDEEVDYTIHLK